MICQTSRFLHLFTTPTPLPMAPRVRLRHAQPIRAVHPQGRLRRLLRPAWSQRPRLRTGAGDSGTHEGPSIFLGAVEGRA